MITTKANTWTFESKNKKRERGRTVHNDKHLISSQAGNLQSAQWQTPEHFTNNLQNTRVKKIDFERGLCTMTNTWTLHKLLAKYACEENKLRSFIDRNKYQDELNTINMWWMRRGHKSRTPTTQLARPQQWNQTKQNTKHMWTVRPWRTTWTTTPQNKPNKKNEQYMWTVNPWQITPN